MAFPPRSRRNHLPHMQDRAGGGFLWGFDPVRLATTSLASNSEPEVVCYGALTPFASPPPPSQATASWGWVLMGLRPRSPRHCLPRMQQRVGGRVLCRFDSVRAAATCSHARLVHRWTHRYTDSLLNYFILSLSNLSHSYLNIL
jgi:hypothetical protein